MGYTHYLPQKKSVSPEAWSQICKDTKTILESQKKASIPLASDHPSEVMVNEKAGYINFNGVGDDSHETFAVSQKHDSQFNFCKTAQKPYDLAVTAVLMVIEHHAPAHFETSSDGDVEDWRPAAELNQKLFGYGYRFPAGVATGEPELAAEIESQLEEATTGSPKPKKKKSRYDL